jgi:hypothetical protein
LRCFASRHPSLRSPALGAVGTAGDKENAECEENAECAEGEEFRGVKKAGMAEPRMRRCAPAGYPEKTPPRRAVPRRDPPRSHPKAVPRWEGRHGRWRGLKRGRVTGADAGQCVRFAVALTAGRVAPPSPDSAPHITTALALTLADSS